MSDATAMKPTLIFILSLIPLHAAASCACQQSIQFLNLTKTAGEPLIAAVNCLPEAALKKPWIWKTAGRSVAVTPEPIEGASGYYNYVLVWLPGERPGVSGTLAIDPLAGTYFDENRKPNTKAIIRVVKEQPAKHQWSLDLLKGAPFGHQLTLSGGNRWRPRNGIRMLRVEISNAQWGHLWQSPLVEVYRHNGKHQFESSECGNMNVGWMAGDKSLIQVLHWSDHRLIPEAAWRVKLPYPVGTDETKIDDAKRIMDVDREIYKKQGCSNPMTAALPPICSQINARLAVNNQLLMNLRQLSVLLEATALEGMRVSQAELDRLAAH